MIPNDIKERLSPDKDSTTQSANTDSDFYEQNSTRSRSDFVLGWFMNDKSSHQTIKWWKLYDYFVPGLVLFCLQFTLFPILGRRNGFLSVAWIMLFVSQIFLNLFPFSCNLYIWFFTFGITSTYYLIARENPGVIYSNSTMIKFAGFDLKTTQETRNRTGFQLMIALVNFTITIIFVGLVKILRGYEGEFWVDCFWSGYAIYNLETIGFTSLFLPTLTPYIYGTNMDNLQNSKKLRNYLANPTQKNCNLVLAEFKIFKRNFMKIKSILMWLESAQVLWFIYVSILLFLYFSSETGDVWNRLGSGESRLIVYLGHNYYIGLLIFFILVELLIMTLKLSVTYFANIKSDKLEADFHMRLDVLSNFLAFPEKSKEQMANLLKENDENSSGDNRIGLKPIELSSKDGKSNEKISPFSRKEIALLIYEELKEQILKITDDLSEQEKLHQAAMVMRAQIKRVKHEYDEVSDIAGYKFLGFFRVDIKLLSQIVMVGVTSILTFVFSTMVGS